MMKKIFCLLLPILILLSGLSAQIKDDVMRVKIQFINQKGGKPPLKFNYTNLTIYNLHDSLRWYLFPYDLNDSLTGNGIFKANEPWENDYIIGKKFPENDTSFKAVEIVFIGVDGFKAFCLPAKSKMQFNYYVFESWGDSIYSSVPCYEVKEMLVNGKTALNKWLPYNVVCSRNIRIKSNDAINHWENLDWDSNTHSARTDYPNEPIKFIEAAGINKMVINFTK